MSASWESIEATFRILFEREWYTNHGPLAKAFETELQQLFHASHVVCVVNPAIALTMALEALQLQQPIAVIGQYTAHTEGALYWSRLLVESDCRKTPSAVLCNGMNSTELEQAQQLANHAQVPLVADLTQTDTANFDHLCTNGLPIRNDATVIAFNPGQAIDAQGAACIATNNAELAETLRNIRSSYGTRATIAVTKTANGRMSEAQAAFGLLNIQALKAKGGTQ